MSNIVKALKIISNYLINSYSDKELLTINKEIKRITNVKLKFVPSDVEYDYARLQDDLAHLNEKEIIRKSKGVYYTPLDVVKFILYNSIKSFCDILKPNNLHVMDLNGVDYRNFCYRASIFDPTCGAGEFIIESLVIKLDLLKLHHLKIKNIDIVRILSTLYGNDINKDSIVITKLRLLLCILKNTSVNEITGIGNILNHNFTCYDYIIDNKKIKHSFDIIVGNPPYVEDSKYDTKCEKRFGNVYANVLENACNHLSNKGVMGFVVPISYISTPRMHLIREELNKSIKEQFLLSYSDRPDCLFTSVHQKLGLLIGKKASKKGIYTGNYRYWYKDEREKLFENETAIKNEFATEDFIPKLGKKEDISIYKKVTRNLNSLYSLLNNGNEKLYLNMRAAFWIKVFKSRHCGKEYKEFNCSNKNILNLCLCLLNSSIFWWYWICTSDCWHITSKELKSFTVPDVEKNIEFDKIEELAKRIEYKLEKTKEYVGSVQTEYEYKHKYCIDEIHKIDNYLSKVFNLTEEENIYIKNFAFKYRMGGIPKHECN